MNGVAGEGRRALLITLVLIGGIAALVWVGVRTGHLGTSLSPVEATTSTPKRSATTSPRPSASATSTPSMSPTPTLVPPDPVLVAAFAALVAELGGEYALAWVDGEGLHLLGEPPDETAWSTIKVPLSIAGVEHGAAAGSDPWPDIDPAITTSDNDAALRLWASLGTPQEAAAAVDEVLAAYGSAGTRTESEGVRPPFTPFGQTQWSLVDQARFAASLACAPGASPAGEVRAVMGRVVEDQRWGIGRVETAHLKSGWGPDDSGAYVLRQLGDGVVDGRWQALALSGRAADGTYPQGAADLSALVEWWARTAADGPSLVCTQ